MIGGVARALFNEFEYKESDVLESLTVKWLANEMVMVNSRACRQPIGSQLNSQFVIAQPSSGDLVRTYTKSVRF